MNTTEQIIYKERKDRYKGLKSNIKQADDRLKEFFSLNKLKIIEEGDIVYDFEKDKEYLVMGKIYTKYGCSSGISGMNNVSIAYKLVELVEEWEDWEYREDSKDLNLMVISENDWQYAKDKLKRGYIYEKIEIEHPINKINPRSPRSGVFGFLGCPDKIPDNCPLKTILENKENMDMDKRGLVEIKIPKTSKQILITQL